MDQPQPLFTLKGHKNTGELSFAVHSQGNYIIISISYASVVICLYVKHLCSLSGASFLTFNVHSLHSVFWEVWDTVERLLGHHGQSLAQ